MSHKGLAPNKSALVQTMKAVALHLALAAMVFRVLLPLGWMPSPLPTRGLPIVMCTMDGPVKIVMTIGSKPNPAKKSNICPFGAAPHFAMIVPMAVRGAPVPLAYREIERSPATVHLALLWQNLRRIRPRGTPESAFQ